ncbi:MAG TPA: asparagine synthase (glutamine-hydrolyzing) [bacterium]|nr:asparagine synthase (glutamine-hydrolyzing) [bacterium]HOL48270.1 asparagine synthase (glutamine-hydrolyzing) [bacterium]HPQ20094.1 asparagine synthase (glutamine-hydrolyzing) [bacterium]
MCGICGFSGKAKKKIIKEMTTVLTHRGPDDEGYFSNDKINFGFRRLSIIDIESGKQPIHNENKKIWAVFNGEIYNHLELRKNLQKKGHYFYTDHSDTEVIVHLYEEYGINFPNYLNGMFAIALWDENKEILFLIRDRIGVKPLFYSEINGRIIFASEIKSILKFPEVKKNINLEAIYHYFSFKNIPAPLTAFENIYSLMPGEILEYSNSKINKEKYWKIDFSNEIDDDEKSIIETISKLLEDAVKLRMQCDVPFGAYLSGGVDSSSVVAIMSQFSTKPIKTFSLGYSDDFKNKQLDILSARKLSKIFKTEHYEYIMSSDELIEDLDNVIEAFDQPFSGTISTYFLSKLIKKYVKVALSGDGSDELFGSYLSHRIAQPMNEYIEKNKLSEKIENFELIKKLYDKSEIKKTDWRYHLFTFTDFEKKKLLTEIFSKFYTKYLTLNLFRKKYNACSSKSPLNLILEYEYKTQFPDQVLAFVDFLSMAHSIEVRSPFFDYRLVEYVAKIPDKLKINNNIVKYILKKSVKNLIPEEIINRSKEGFVLPVYQWLENKYENFIRDILSEKRLKKHNFFNQDYVKTLLNNFYIKKNKEPAKIWILVNFQLWWEKYFG